MALENHRTGLFDTLALPPLHESYRDLILSQLYQKFDAVPFQSICWATPEKGLGPNSQSDIVVLPGEERYALENHGVSFSYLKRKAYSCPYHKEEIRVKREAGEDGQVETVTPHYCTLDISSRPLLCRAFPFAFGRIPSENRKFKILVDRRGMNTLQRRSGSVLINQLFHSIIQVAISMWPFLDDRWWSYYENAYSNRWKFKSYSEISFTLNDDVILSNIKGAPPAWRTEILAQVAEADCPACEGQGIEFWDRNAEGNLLPVSQRRFDICRKCVAPAIGASFGDLLVDPTTRKVLSADGSEYRGDQVLKKELK